jgi:hypothetical protein
MSARPDNLVPEKELLLMRSALCRLRLRRATHDLRSSLPWKRVALAAATAPAVRPIAFGIVLSLVGLRRVARGVVIASRILFFAKLAGSLIDYARRAGRSRACAIEQTDGAIAPRLGPQPRNIT